ncbi:MFS transporter [Acetobacter ascendens]|uniref:Putative sialic acid transporter n=1 Tax=Acetobacter ascendens TaxID=481146 RepID=A0A1Y0VA13_9PROT|nr:MFS transporter [Acetobacter ascendens]ARW11617.1 Putative sialic acid transporter [Acetobacter ascendens]
MKNETIEGVNVPLRATIALFALGSCALLNIYATQPILPDIAHQFNVSLGASAWTISASTLGVAVAAPLAGAISDRFGRKYIIVMALIGLIITTASCALAWNFIALLSLRFAQGILVPFVFTAALAYIAEEWSGRAATTMNGVYVAGTAFGGFCGRFLAGVAAAFTGWLSTFLVFAVLLSVVLVLTLFCLPTERQFRPSASLTDSLKNVAKGAQDWRLLATCFIGASLLFQQVTSFTYLSLRLGAPPFSLTSIEVGVLFVVFLLPVMVTPFFGQLISRIGRTQAFLLSQIIGIAGIVLTLAFHLSSIVVGLALSCMAVFAGQSCATGYTARHTKTGRSAATGLYLTCYYLGGSIGAVAPAPLYAQYGWFGCAALICFVALASAALARAAWREAVIRKSEAEA